MKKELGIIVDSFAGEIESELKKIGMFLIAQQVIVKGRVFFPGKEGTQNPNVLKEIKADPSVDIKTSTPSIGQIEEVFDIASKEYEQVLYIAMQKNLSNTFSVGTVASNGYDNVSVIDSKLSGNGIIYLGKHLRKMYSNNESMEAIIEFAKNYLDDAITIIVPKDTKRLVAGGRVSGMKKLVLQAGKFIPQLLVTDSGFTSRGLKRSFKKSLDSIAKWIKTEKPNTNDYIYEGIHTGDTYEDIKAAVESIGGDTTTYSLTSDPVIAHTSSGIGFSVYKKL